jgi:Domain of unknown function (DUF4249)
MKRLLYHIILLLLFIATACEEEISIDLKDVAPGIVIDGKISNCMPGTVRISRTTDYFSPGLPDPVTGASVILKNGTGSKEILTEVVPGTYHSVGLPGLPGDTYTLRVESSGKAYTAVSTMPVFVTIDSLRQEFVSGGRFFDSGYFIHLYYKDPPGTRNFYRMKSYKNGVENTFLHLFDDRLSDGLTIHYFFFNEPYQPGDTAVIELNSIDFESYDYLLTLSNVSAANQGGPGATPANPNTNFDNGALGYFSAYTVETDTLIIQEGLK